MIVQVSAIGAVPPPFHEVVVNPTRAGGLAHLPGVSFSSGNLPETKEFLGWFTVAGQRRTLTGFAFNPSHPGGKAPLVVNINLCTDSKRGLDLSQGNPS
jgi:hypothetical protein